MALTSFSGVISMSMGEVREISDKAIVRDLLKAGYIQELKETNIKKVVEQKDTKIKKGVKKKSEN
jgi:hypothetical protein